MIRNSDPLMTPGEVAQLMRVCSRTVTRWVKAGRIPATRTPGGHVRIRRSVVLALLDPS